ncbi:MAG: CPBP family intramembrane metalloprotease [Bacteroidales bacterium]|nr:CPBP family intramembrane metalloprotease [Bacteroidales bacterium]
MKKEIKIALIIVFGFMFLLWLEKPLREYLMKCIGDELFAKFIAGIAVRLTILCITIYLIFKLNLNKFTGLDSKMRMKNLHSIIIALAFIVIGILNNWGIYSSIELTKLILFTTSVIIIGFLEEFVFRGTILPLFIKSLKGKKQILYLSVSLSAFLFGCIHFINLLNQPENVGGVTSQVFFSFSIGVFLEA